jgi:hypothetical protein
VGGKRVHDRKQYRPLEGCNELDWGGRCWRKRDRVGESDLYRTIDSLQEHLASSNRQPRFRGLTGDVADCR